MAEEFVRAVEDGLRLSKRIYFGKDRAVAPPKQLMVMEKMEVSLLPSAPMAYAVIGDPAIVDNTDIPSYQPHVHGRCDPPALIPLQMNGIAVEVDCFMDTAFVTVTGSWRVHCVMGSRSCDCLIAIPMGGQGSILGVEVDTPMRSYCTHQVVLNNEKDTTKVSKIEDVGFLKSHIFTLKIPQVDGGSNLSIKVRWSQKNLYHEGQFTLNIPFTFPDYVTPAGKKISKKEMVQLNVNCGLGTEVLCKTGSHPMKELHRRAGKVGFLYESEVLSWSRSDFVFQYSVSSDHIFGGVLLQSPSVLDIDQREMFCIYLFPGNQERKKAFNKEVVFVVDISESMSGKPLEDTKNALTAALSKLEPDDSFSVIAFNDETCIFSSSLELATAEAITEAKQWISRNFIASGGTNILLPLTQTMEMFSNTQNSIPIIFLITDGSVKDERHICDVLETRLTGEGSLCPRINTFGIGSFCNHYFLQKLSMIGKGHHGAAYDADLVEVQMERLFDRALSTILANITIDGLNDLQELELLHSPILDLSSAHPLVLPGRYRGVFPISIKATGILPDMSNLTIDLKVQNDKDIPLDKVLAKHQIEVLTAQAWFSEDRELEEKVSKMSVQNGILSEYTCMILTETEKVQKSKASNKTDPQMSDSKVIFLTNLGVGFGNLAATEGNLPPVSNKEKTPDTAEILAKAASGCCGKLCDHCCCMCCIQTCSRMNDQFAIVLSQLLGGLACLGCVSCCELCCSGEDS